MHTSQLLSDIKWNDQGLVPVIVQDNDSHRVLMMAWMNAESLNLTLNEGRAVYWSRSRQRLWRKGEESGNQQKVISIFLDCDGDTLLLEVEQIGGIACHTGRVSCFYRGWSKTHWEIKDPVLVDPSKWYTKESHE